MTRRVGGVAFAAVLALALTLWPGAARAAQPGDPLNHAGVIVRHGDGRLIYAYVAFPEETITGIELLRRTGVPLVTVGFGALGEGICAIADEGCPASDCRQRVCQGAGDEHPFWQYFRQAGPGEWRPLTLGASSTRVRDGDLDGWSWTPHDAHLPDVSLADVARLSGAGSAEIDAAAGPIPAAAVREISPPGVTPPSEGGRQGWLVYAAALGLLTALGLAGGFAVWRTRTGRGAV